MNAPAAMAAPVHEYATHIPNRRPAFKTHRGAGQAKNAVINKLYGDPARCEMVIYRLQDGEYKPWLRIEPGQRRKDVPELAPKPPPRTHIAMEIRSLIEQERYHLERAEQVAAKRRELEAAL